MAAIKAAIDKCPEEYSVFDIESKLIENGTPMKRTAISQTLSRMKDELTIKTKGAGRKPTIYMKTKHQPAEKAA